MGESKTLHWTGRARVSVAAALLLPPLLMFVLWLLDQVVIDKSNIWMLWGTLIVATVTATYLLFAMAKLITWVCEGLSATERVSLAFAARCIFRILILTTVFFSLTLLRYEIFPMPLMSVDSYLKHDRWTGEVTAERTDEIRIGRGKRAVYLSRPIYSIEHN